MSLIELIRWDTIAYYHHDHLGTPIQATDRGGIVVWSAQYSAFGQATITTPTATDDKPVIASSLRFPGQVEDAETGLYYNWHRYYDPALGRYVTADSIKLWGGVNFYAYVGGNPVNLTDPLGLNPGYHGDDGTCGFWCWFDGIYNPTPPVYATKPVDPTDKTKPVRTPEEEAKADAENKSYHKICDRPPPENLDPCELARWQYRQAKMCYEMRENWETRWGNEASRQKHADQLAQVKKRMANAASDIAKYCGDQQCPN